MKYAVMVLMAFALVLQTFNLDQANKRAERWKVMSNSLLETDRKNRTTIAQYDCLLNEQVAFTRTATLYAMHPKGELKTPDMEACLKIVAPPIEELAKGN
jgi:hypothetical protein